MDSLREKESIEPENPNPRVHRSSVVDSLFIADPINCLFYACIGVGSFSILRWGWGEPSEANFNTWDGGHGQRFSKSCLVNLISKDTYLVFSIYCSVLYLVVAWVGLWYMILTFPGHTHFFLIFSALQEQRLRRINYDIETVHEFLFEVEEKLTAFRVGLLFFYTFVAVQLSVLLVIIYTYFLQCVNT